MNIVIPLGNGSIWDNNELRYCLRSIEKYCWDYDEIIIIGERPNWLTNIIHIPFKETAKHELNIWHKVMEACKHVDEFLFCNDDFFFLKPFSSSYPNYHSGDISEFLKTHKPASYYNVVQKTYRVLSDHSLPTLFYDIHRPIVINSERFLEMSSFFNPQTELTMKSCYGNYHRL